MLHLSHSIYAVILTTLVCLLQLASQGSAAIQCDVVANHNCGNAKHSMTHKLPAQPGSTYYADGFHGGIIYAKLQSVHQSIPGNSDNIDLTYNFDLGAYDGTYWIILPTSFGDADECYAVYKNCDVSIRFWEKDKPLPSWYTLA